MSFKLKEIVFRIRCTEPGCSFDNNISIKENLMGATESDIDIEAWKIAKNQAFIKHDSLFGRNHPLSNPEIRKVSGFYDRIGGGSLPITQFPVKPALSVPTRTFAKGERIIRKGERATTVCEVVQGFAFNARRAEMVYRPGATFGSAALLQHKNRMADIMAGEDGTIIAFYDLRTLSKTEPVKARALYNEAMEDIFRVIEYLEDYSQSLELQLERIRAAGRAPKTAARPARKAVKSAAKKKAPGKKAASKKSSAKPKARKSAAKPKARPAAKARKVPTKKTASRPVAKKAVKKRAKARGGKR